MSLQTLVNSVCAYYEKEGRAHLPWRKTTDPYCIVVSEYMLQQTQVARVVEKYQSFLSVFPSFAVLSRAPLSKVLQQWQGLGYNRRAKYLHQTAIQVMKQCGGKLPSDPVYIETFPGIGHYTARAIAIFAFNKPEVCIETNIRTVFTHFCFPKKQTVADAELLPLIEKALHLAQKKGYSPRAWYSALMDYGVYLKQRGVRINYRSAHYTKQSSFKGSIRELRGAILRELLHTPATSIALARTLSRSKTEVAHQLVSLQKEGMIEERGNSFRVVGA